MKKENVGVGVLVGVYATSMILGAAFLIAMSNPFSVLLGIMLIAGAVGTIYGMLFAEEEVSEETSEQPEVVREVIREREVVYVVREADGTTRLEGRVIDGETVDTIPVVRDRVRPAPARRR